MVMATEVLHSGQQVDHEDTELDGDSGEASVLHEQLVRHVLAISGELDSRSDVWGEHSYARARGAASNSQIRSLLPETEPELEPGDLVDVETAPRGAPTPPLDRHGDEGEGGEGGEGGEELAAETGDEDEDDDWERRVAALAPSAAHARLAAAAADTLRALRLERLAGARGRWARREGARAAARRLRRALAPHWAGGAAWLHAALLAALPRELRALYAELVRELRRAAPRLAERLPAPRPAPPAPDPLDAAGEPRDASAPGPWLAWAPSGSDAEDERWLRRLGALLHVRRLRPPAPPPAPASPPPPAQSPERWCAALAHDARAALADVLAEAGEERAPRPGRRRRAVLLGGAGAGAALAAWLAAGAGSRVRGVLLLAPPPHTAEGARDALRELGAPLLAVVGGAAAGGGAAGELAAAGAARRVLRLAGADEALRLPRARRRRLRLPQQALDAAVAEECARWATEVADAAPRARKHDEPRAAGVNRTLEVIEGRVMPPRRAELAAADIMRLPIVFADDEPPAPAPAPAPALAPAPAPAPAEPALAAAGPRRAGGALQYTRVIVAKRGPRPVLLRRRAPPAPPAPPAP